MENYGGGGSRLGSIDRDNASSTALLPQINLPYKNRNEGKNYASTIQPNGPIKALASDRASYHNLIGKHSVPQSGDYSGLVTATAKKLNDRADSSMATPMKMRSNSTLS